MNTSIKRTLAHFLHCDLGSDSDHYLMDYALTTKPTKGHMKYLQASVSKDMLACIACAKGTKALEQRQILRAGLDTLFGDQSGFCMRHLALLNASHQHGEGAQRGVLQKRSKKVAALTMSAYTYTTRLKSSTKKNWLLAMQRLQGPE